MSLWLDADRHQYLAALRHDVDTDRYHVHLAINKVSLDGRVVDRWQDYAKLGRAVHLTRGRDPERVR